MMYVTFASHVQLMISIEIRYYCEGLEDFVCSAIENTHGLVFAGGDHVTVVDGQTEDGARVVALLPDHAAGPWVEPEDRLVVAASCETVWLENAAENGRAASVRRKL